MNDRMFYKIIQLSLTKNLFFVEVIHISSKIHQLYATSYMGLFKRKMEKYDLIS